MKYESEEWFDNLTDEEYQDYFAERIMCNLEYLVSEGFVKTKVNEEGELMYCLKSEDEIAKEVSEVSNG